MLGEYVKYTANTGIGSVSTANTSLSGSGTFATVLTASDNGTLIKSVTIKSEVALADGNIIRLGISPDGGDTVYVFKEIFFRPAGGGTGAVFATAQQIVPINFPLKSGYILMASTNLAKAFSVVAEGLNMTYP